MRDVLLPLLLLSLLLHLFLSVQQARALGWSEEIVVIIVLFVVLWNVVGEAQSLLFKPMRARIVPVRAHQSPNNETQRNLMGHAPTEYLPVQTPIPVRLGSSPEVALWSQVSHGSWKYEKHTAREPQQKR